MSNGSSSPAPAAGPSGQPVQPPWVKRLLSTKEEDNQHAYELQLRGAKEGAIRWTIYSTLLCGVGHTFWPTFRRQTLAFKGFIVSSAAMSGMVIWADHYLLRHEKWQRKADDMMRREARDELGRKGIIVTEQELQKWKDAKLAEYGGARNLQT